MDRESTIAGVDIRAQQKISMERASNFQTLEKELKIVWPLVTIALIVPDTNTTMEEKKGSNVGPTVEETTI